jgi:hypothetical protein
MIGVHKKVSFACREVLRREQLRLTTLALKRVNAKDKSRTPSNRASNHLDQPYSVELALTEPVIAVGPIGRSRRQHLDAKKVYGTALQLCRSTVAGCGSESFSLYRLCEA